MADLMAFLEKEFQIKPKNPEIYIQAFTHKSFSNEHKDQKHYEMLEFLGDALVNFKATLFIFQKLKLFDEGQASVKRSQIIDTNALARISQQLKLSQFMRVSKGSLEIIENKKVCADLFEALTGAIYLDQGEKKLDYFLEKTLYNLIWKERKELKKDPKTEFQEIMQSLTKQTGEYVVKKEKDLFYAELIFDGQIFGKGKGKSKKEAEVAAATRALETFRKGK
ncbi:ribonuclease III [Mycoplasma procyoni]|uniref:ribonuclease III n=1 Tax=Mycoplasma procyoni TaxID=568784 RepID=UPI00197B97F9|nr:ribonuclease III [Mycoplasma procyoni]MBN3534355.1 ribonuclease III [Mycoplasma procyoni]